MQFINSLWKRLPIYHPNPAYLTATRKFSVRTKLFTSSHQVPSQQKVDRLMPGHTMATTKDSTLVKAAVMC